MAFLKLIRWPNLLMIAIVQYLIRYFITLNPSLAVPHVLDHLEYLYGVLCSVSLAAAGYVINDINDLDTDRENKPQRMVLERDISLASAWQIYFGLNILSLFTGYMVAKAAGMPNLWMVPLIAIFLLYFYAVDLKKRAVIGNLLVSFLTALPVMLVALFDILPAISADNQDIVRSIVTVITAYALFAFWTNFIREIVKDAEDERGDKKYGYKTLAVLLGKSQIRYVIIILTLVLLSFTGFYNVFIFGSDRISALYILLFINIPTLYFIFIVFRAREAADFKKASKLIKLIMLTGILSMVVFSLALKL